MRTALRWIIRISAIVVAAAIAVPAGQKLYEAHQPMPLPTHVWTKPAASVTVRQVPPPTNTQPLTVYIPELGVVLPFHDAGQTAGWLDIGHSITSGVHFADGSTLTRGSYLVAAHVNSRDLSLSPFAKLWKIEPGTLIWVTDTAGTLHEFKTVALNYYDKNNLPTNLWDTQGSSSIALVTCGGKLTINPDGSRHYADNVVVRGAPVTTTASGTTNATTNRNGN